MKYERDKVIGSLVTKMVDLLSNWLDYRHLYQRLLNGLPIEQLA